MGRKIIFNVTVYIYLGKRSKGEFNPMCLVNKQNYLLNITYLIKPLFLVHVFRCQQVVTGVFEGFRGPFRFCVYLQSILSLLRNFYVDL